MDVFVAIVDYFLRLALSEFVWEVVVVFVLSIHLNKVIHVSRSYLPIPKI